MAEVCERGDGAGKAGLAPPPADVGAELRWRQAPADAFAAAISTCNACMSALKHLVCRGLCTGMNQSPFHPHQRAAV